MKLLKFFIFLELTLPSYSEPGVAIIYEPGQTNLAGQAKAYLQRLIEQNALAPHQFSLRSVELSTPEGRQFKRKYELTSVDLPALAYYQREGNRVTLRSMVRAYRDPLKAAQAVFQHVQLEEPRLIQSATLFTGAEIRTDPPAARVLLGDTELGVTPCLVPLKPGDSRLRLSHPDYLGQSLRLQLKPGQVVKRELTLTPAASHLTIESQGATLEITLDGKPLGPTPVVVETIAGLRSLSASAPGYKTLNLEIPAQAQTSMQVTLLPIADQVGIAVGEVTADGYLIGRGFDSLPFPTSGVELSAVDFADRLRKNLKDHHLVSSGQDCTLNLNVDAWERFVKAELTILDRTGRPLHTLMAERAMPWLTLDEQGSARHRGVQLVDELSSEAVRWILQNVTPRAASQAELEASLQLRGVPYPGRMDP